MHVAQWKALLFVIAIFSTFFCTAVNCYTYRIAYPLWRWVGLQEFAPLHREYLRRLLPVITLPHVVMLFSSGLLLVWHPAYLSMKIAAPLFALNAAVVLISLIGAGPIHDRFSREKHIDKVAFARLMTISAIRVVMMIAASAFILYGLVGALSAPGE